MVGGLYQDLLSIKCFEIDGNMNMLERAPMSRGRYNVALNLISDRFIFAIGGYAGRNIPSDTVECLDVVTN